jgi:hypothetical protein
MPSVFEVTEGQAHVTIALGLHCRENTLRKQSQRAGAGKHLIGQTVRRHE